ncbi:MAG: NifU family protein [Bacteroidales bacterium]|nr:NifU family protein [Bacteroidales bacterium]
MERDVLERKVKNILIQIEPYLKADGGGVEFVKLDDDMVVWVKLTGHCANCPHSSQTLKNGIEKTMKSVLPEIKAVEKVES